MNFSFVQLKDELGVLGAGAFALLAASLLFFITVVRPLEERATRLERELKSATQRMQLRGYTRVSAHAPAGELDAFYRYFDRDARPDAWLAKIYGIALAAGFELRMASYRVADSRQRIERYQITLPLSGSYTRIRSFLSAVLSEIPVLSLEQVSFRRKAEGDSKVEAEVVLTLHLLKR